MGNENRFLKEFVAVRLPTALMKQLQAVCQREQKTTSDLIREAIVNRVKKARDGESSVG